MLLTAKKKLYYTLVDIVYTDAIKQFRSNGKGIIEYDTFNIAQLAEQNNITLLGINTSLFVKAFTKVRQASLIVYYEGGPIFRIVLKAQL